MDPLEKRRRQRKHASRRLWIGLWLVVCVAMFFAGLGLGRLSYSPRKSQADERAPDESGMNQQMKDFRHITDGLKK